MRCRTFQVWQQKMQKKTTLAAKLAEKSLKTLPKLNYFADSI